MNREEWLQLAISRIRKDILPELPEVAVSVGWPSKGATSRNRRVLGQCWESAATADGRPAIFISPVAATAAEALSILIHECVHACGRKGHGKRFAQLGERIGMVGPWKSAGAGPVLQQRLNEMMPEPYPHAAITPGDQKRQSTRLLKVVCPDCGYTARITAKWIEVGCPTCPCGTHMEEAQ